MHSNPDQNMDDHLKITWWLAEYTLHQNLHRYLTDWPNLDDEKFDSDIQRLESKQDTLLFLIQLGMSGTGTKISQNLEVIDLRY